ncbi:MAG: aldehyde dehydrogenase family protein [Deltaproteobacteria bacterium]
MADIIERRMFIGGKWVSSSAGEVSPIINPATGDVIARVPVASAEDVRAAALAARRAFDEGKWRRTPQPERGRLLLRVAESIRAAAAELALAETRNSGKPIREARVDVEDAASCFEFFAGLADKISGEVIPTPDANVFAMTLREPIGVIAQIIPWNYPLLMAAWKLAPALATGNCSVLKPSELTPLTALRLGEFIAQAGFPPGVVNIVTGAGEVGSCIASDENVDKIAFTGSLHTGKKVMRAASESVKRLSLELGGKSAAIVFPDADLDNAVRWSAFGIFANQGQMCSATSRLIVHESIHDRFVGELVKLAEGIKIGNPEDEATQMATLISGRQLIHALGYIETGRREGARLVSGGRRLDGGELRRGFYLAPTIFTDVSADMTIAREEIFAPVLAVMKFGDERQAVQIANQSRYGLAGAVFTKDLSRAHRVAREIQAGVVWVNSSQMVFSQLPWGGVKMSGFGSDLGRSAAYEYTEPKQVTMNLADTTFDWYSS